MSFVDRANNAIGNERLEKLYADQIRASPLMRRRWEKAVEQGLVPRMPEGIQHRIKRTPNAQSQKYIKLYTKARTIHGYTMPPGPPKGTAEHKKVYETYLQLIDEAGLPRPGPKKSKGKGKGKGSKGMSPRMKKVWSNRIKRSPDVRRRWERALLNGSISQLPSGETASDVLERKARRAARMSPNFRK